ncbi:MAG TPA: diguanylate cyclase [Candidatus Saccharicenans sp.]|jgi:diguanylate cyclase (GGDEF)-like protein/PAS domain S-box-containing protein|nr:diguanylate cyclase [Candidatus Saccharicenans sp.]HPC88236.1 diguanylate cyclase [Candidatus Saccharicenans sp.]HQE64433.1 diguanylate cyclase [Candidatus Saccharicenans sp.]HQH60747.1 diguanylate cyclase [Candidatus Saccharicenans sp.]HQI22086.1 diguanylate cyclase [Candidatus Saccharicenans sp.]
MSEKLILETLDRLEDRYLNRLLDQITDGCLILDKGKNYIFWNKSAEALSGFPAEQILNKSCQAEPPLFINSSGRPLCEENCLCDQALKDGQPRLLDVYLQHKNGFRLPVRLKIIPLLNGDGQSVGLAEIFTDISPAVAIPLKMGELEKMQLLDLDTGLPNRLYMEMYLKNKIDEYQKYGLPFGLIYADVDNFNKIQERFGRFNSAKLIRMIARTFQKNIRYFDIVCRWENEEFLICLLNIDENRLDIVANKLRLLVAESYITVETGLLNATVSMGATLVQRFDTIESLVKRAEELMLHSKWLGRNKVSLTFTQKET